MRKLSQNRKARKYKISNKEQGDNLKDKKYENYESDVLQNNLCTWKIIKNQMEKHLNELKGIYAYRLK